jgi:hypothetical protein
LLAELWVDEDMSTAIRVVFAAFVASTLAACVTCTPRVTEKEAIRLAEEQLKRSWGVRPLPASIPLKATLRDCVWTVVGETPPQDLSGSFVIDVDARSGRVEEVPRLRTDPRKVSLLQKRR